jgi:hypothetical protein
MRGICIFRNSPNRDMPWAIVYQQVYQSARSLNDAYAMAIELQSGSYRVCPIRLQHGTKIYVIDDAATLALLILSNDL